MKVSYFDLLTDMCKDFEERINRDVGGISKVVVEEQFLKRKWERKKTLVLIVKTQFFEITRGSSWVLKNEGTLKVRDDIAKRIVHNYFCFGLYKTYKDKNNKRLSRAE